MVRRPRSLPRLRTAQLVAGAQGLTALPPPRCALDNCRSNYERFDGASDPGSVFFGSINLEDGAGFYPGDGVAEDAAAALAAAEAEEAAAAAALAAAKRDDALVGAAGGSVVEAAERAEAARTRATLQRNIVNVTLTPVSPTIRSVAPSSLTTAASRVVPPPPAPQRLCPVVAVRPGDLRGRARQSQRDRLVCKQLASEQFRTRVAAQLVPKLLAFEPDLLLVSAGFDGAIIIIGTGARGAGTKGEGKRCARITFARLPFLCLCAAGGVPPYCQATRTTSTTT